MKNNIIKSLLGCCLLIWSAASFSDEVSTQDKNAGAASTLFPLKIPLSQGPFKPTTESLKNYHTPEWYRDAKFGIWAHWGPQAVPRAGDWYARNMYIPGTDQYDHHLKHYGHPSETGYKDIIKLWHAEKFDPDALMKLYVKAGAKYFVTVGVEHDNFDLWHSKHHRWNSVNMGPKRDIVGEWKRATKKYGLRFGVSEHLGVSYSWFTPSHGYDQFWPKMGVPYDGANPEYKDLYHSGTDTPYRDWNTWYTKNPESQQNWFNRISDLVNQHQPDLLYTDGGLPFGEVGRSLIANFYNDNIARHKGKLQAVYSYKDVPTGEFIREVGAPNFNRASIGDIELLPWQADASVGDWFYSDGHTHKTTSEIVHTLADIVSKNGNLLLNVALYADGSLPPEPRKFLDEMAAWMAINGEAIHGTRPWKIFGEGPNTRSKDSNVYTAQDIRFTSRKNTLYAITLGVPTQDVKIFSLRNNSPHETRKIKSVALLGHNSLLTWHQDNDGLVINLPEKLLADYSISFKIEFK